MKKSFIILTILLLSFSIFAQVAKVPAYFSTEEDFMSKTATGVVYVSDGDLLDWNGIIVKKNAQLLAVFYQRNDLGLDAVDVIVRSFDPMLIVFSTELDSEDDPSGSNVVQFTAGDLLSTGGMVIPNVALLVKFNIPAGLDLGLDAVQMTGTKENILTFINEATIISREEFVLNPGLLIDLLVKFDVDILISTEGTGPMLTITAFIDGDVLSVKTGMVVASNGVLLPAPVNAGIPSRGVDYGVDAIISPRKLSPSTVPLIYYSTEILNVKPFFTDGDVMKIGSAVPAFSNWVLIQQFNPPCQFLGLDALSYFD